MIASPNIMASVTPINIDAVRSDGIMYIYNIVQHDV